jgi:serine/threonine protein kinase
MDHVDATFPLYAGSDPVFYDKPRPTAATAADHFTLTDEMTGGTWHRADDDTWSFWAPEEAMLPEQGWKIHVSATPATAEAVLQLVSQYCHCNALPFKFLKHRRVLDATLAKDGDRRLSGKFVAIYPASPSDLELHLTQLDAVLAGMPGPYVLTDLRWKQGPVFVRYGAFIRHLVSDNGVDVPAIRDLDTGQLVPDIRTTSFHVPPWVQIPDFLQTELDRLEMTPPDGFPQVRGALHFSNAGGVYEADLEGRPVILKEARPHIGWTPDGRDAVQRLHHEASLLTSLHGDVPVPAAIKTYDAHGHSYLAMERIDALSLNAAVASRNPLVTSLPTRRERRAYRDWASGVTASLRSAIAALHYRGRVHGDLHPANVLVRDDLTVVLIDLEMSQPVDSPTTGRIGAPGYVAPDGRSGVEQDLYALACIELFMFVPLIPLLSLSNAKAEQLVREAATQFELDSSWVDGQLATLRRRDATDVDTVDAMNRSHSVAVIAKTLLSDATPGRGDRLWPGDPAQFAQPPTSLAHGALGVLMVLHRAGVEAPSEIVRWPERAECEGIPRRLGLMDGLAGAVWAYRQMGKHELADRTLRELLNSPHDRAGSDLYGGLPGLGLTMLHEADQQPAFTAQESSFGQWASSRRRRLRRWL